ncbi:hypothetical protein AB0N09_35780 [Streptomyces erythrochromogenes]|uniref:hypothetical protein n=1 Tax=Streptomyces erythrochromogenes TaxID=285574 RepID=UPI0034223BEE
MTHKQNSTAEAPHAAVSQRRAYAALVAELVVSYAVARFIAYLLDFDSLFLLLVLNTLLGWALLPVTKTAQATGFGLRAVLRRHQ